MYVTTMAKSKTKTAAKAETISVIVKADAPFDVLKHGDCKVGKELAVDAPATITDHRHAQWLDILS